MKLSVKELAVFSLLGAIMFCSKLLTELLPNVHFLAMLIIAYTVVFRAKALYAVFTFIMLSGLYYGFATWWVPYLYIWPLLWGAAMLLPQNMPDKTAVPVYMITAALHGLLYGTLYAPFQALAFGLSFKAMLAWIVAGFPWDLLHAAGNLCVSVLTVPVINILKKGARITNLQIKT